MKGIAKQIYNILDDVLAYILTVLGILASNYVDEFTSGNDITLSINPIRIGMACLISFAFVFNQEKINGDDEDSKTKSRLGKQKNFKRRMANALAQGFMWAQLMNIGGK